MSEKTTFHAQLFAITKGYVSVPNVLIDIVLPLLGPTEWKVFTILWRETIGRQRWSTRLSLSRIRTLSGLSRPTVNRAIQSLRHSGLFDLKNTGINTFTIDPRALLALTSITETIPSLKTLRFHIDQHRFADQDIPEELWEQLLAITSERGLSRGNSSVSIGEREENDGGEDSSVSDTTA